MRQGTGRMWINSFLNQLFCIKHTEIGERENVEQGSGDGRGRYGALCLTKPAE